MTERVLPAYYRPRGRGNKIHQTYRVQQYVPNRQKYGIPGGVAWTIGEVRPASTYRAAVRNVYFNRAEEKNLINYRAYRKALLRERSRTISEDVRADGWAVRL